MRRLFLILLLVCAAGSAWAQTPAQMLLLFGKQQYTGPGDLVPNATAWYGLRAYSRAVAATGTQKAINIRTARDNSTADILILPSGALDTATAAAFAQVDATGTGAITGTALTFTGGHVGDVVTGGTTAAGTVIVSGASPAWTVNISQTVVSATLTLTWGSFVTKWYDQSGSFDVSQATAGSQPQLLVNGYSGSSLPCIFFNGGPYLESASTINIATQPITESAIYIRTGNFTSFSNVISRPTTNSPTISANNAVNSVIGYAGTVSAGVTAADSAWHAVQALFSGASSSINVDGSTTAALSMGTTTFNSKIDIGANAGASGLIGNIREAGVWPSDTSGTWTALGANQRNYYGF